MAINRRWTTFKLALIVLSGGGVAVLLKSGAQEWPNTAGCLETDVNFATTQSLEEDLTMDGDQADGVPSITLVISSLTLYLGD